MEEEIGIKVTRLRRKSLLPAENEETKSPSTQSTPTKKRGGRLAAKPQLDFIDENETDGEKPKKTRKSIARDIETDETPVTPSRRSTRIRSNTSNVSEVTNEAEDKGTPSRRSNRIRSNTSIVAETTSYDSPRAKRAARRTSQIGSDSESTITPARQTRRARKDSPSSIDKPVDSNLNNLTTQTNEIIVEEVDNDIKENNNRKSSEKDRNDSPTIRGSPRLVEKTDEISLSKDDNKENELLIVKELNKTDKGIESRVEDTESKTKSTQNEVSEDNTFSMASSNLTSDMETKFKNRKASLNKSTPALNEPKPQRHRTKSWTTIYSPPSDNNLIMSDTEIIKKKKKKKVDIYNLSIASASGDGVLNTSKEKLNKCSHNNEEDHIEGILLHKKSDATSITEISPMDVSTANTSQKRDKSKSELKRSSLGNVSNLSASAKDDCCMTEKILGTAPSGYIESTVYIDDSDSNSNEKLQNVNKERDTGDQCVPIIKHQLEVSESHNPEHEPMDIDETLPEYISLSCLTENDTLIEQPKRDSILKNTYGANNNSTNTESKSGITNLEIDNHTKVDKTEETLNNSTIKRKSISIIIKDDNVANDDGENNNLITSKRKSSIRDSDHNNTINNILAENGNLTKSSCNNSSEISRSEYNTQSQNSYKTDADSYDITNKITKSPGSKNQSQKNSVTAHLDDEDSNVFDKNQVDASMESSQITSCGNENVGIINKKGNKSKRKSSTNETTSNVDDNPNVTKIDSFLIDVMNHEESIKKSVKKMKSKSSLSNIEDDNNVSSSKSDKSHNDDKKNKSTLVLSQIIDKQNNGVENNEPLSKSLNIPNLNKNSDKKNLSLVYSTSTPLQHNSKKKLGMHLNTSVITPSNATQNKKKDISITEKQDSHSFRSGSSSEENGDSDEEESVDTYIDKEAEEASDDYESGNSRDEFEKNYEKQNEIIEKGETLDSEEEEDYSDNSEYEKGSFIVDSVEEDDDLLSGSGDDLSMSADELSMSTQSKLKFNQRKIKEQKKASREMFQSRHKLNESDKSAKSDKTKTKKSNSRKLESSDSEFENQDSVHLKKRCARIDSSQEINLTKTDANDSISNMEKKRKNKVRCLSDSEFENDATSEDEIAIQQSIGPEKEDPLSVQNVKEEPNTSQRNFNISTVAIMNAEEMKEVDVDENVTMLEMNSNETSDPLDNTVTQNDLMDSDESISENEEITQNYESVLNDLNIKSKNLKSLDLSLNLNKKAKKKAIKNIIDELNLTEVKSKKDSIIKNEKSKKNTIDKSSTNTSNAKTTINVQDEGSSDSIDMKLLFDEDSTESEIKPKTENEKLGENFIPLKRTEGKTNIAEDDLKNKLSKNDIVMNTSSSKERRKSHQPTETVTNNQKDEDLNFFIDTTGTHFDVDDSVIYTTSAKKKKRKNNSISITNIEEVQQDDDSNDAPLEVCYQSEKNRSKTKDVDQINISILETTETPSKLEKTKKKNKKDLDNSQIKIKEQSIEDDNLVNSEKSTSKKRKRKHSANQSIEQVDQEDRNNLDTSKSFIETNQKKKRKIIQESENNDDQMQELQKNNKQVEPADTHVIEKNKSQEDSQRVNEDANTLNSSNTNDSNQMKSKTFHKTEDSDSLVPVKKNKKRKERDYDDGYKLSKINKQNSFDTVYDVPRLPNSVIKQLDEKTKKNIVPKTNIISTTSFKVEETRKRKNKPSNYLEQSVYLNDSLEENRKKSLLKKPKVLPFIPTASTSDCGFTTNFKVNVLPQVTQFVGQSNDVSNFKIDYLQNNRIKKLGTFEKYKRHRNIKLSKF